MLRKVLAVTTTVVLPCALWAVLDSGVAGATPRPAQGTVSCSISGTGRFAPKLTLSGSSLTLGMRFSGSGSGCTSSATTSTISGVPTPVTISAVTVHALGTLVPLSTGLANACSTFDSFDTIGLIKVRYNWTSVPAIAPTVVTYSGGTTNIVSGLVTDDLNLPATGTVVTGTGSFAPPATAPLTLATNVPAPCIAGWGPYRGFTFGVGSTFSLP